ncbi:MAG: hypothetical protein ACRDDY_11545 [Clostridium sp.]
MKKETLELRNKFYSFFYFIFWGFYFSAGYFVYEKKNSSIVLSI